MTSIIYSIDVDDIQAESLNYLNRKLNDLEIEIIKKKLEWGINTSLPIVYDSIFQDIKVYEHNIQDEKSK